jgi:hypothetical protein
MIKTIKYGVYFGFLAGVGILLGCWIHGIRTNQPMIMSGVAFVRELPKGELVVGRLETWVFSHQEEKALQQFKEENKGKIQIDPEVLRRHQELYKDTGKQAK